VKQLNSHLSAALSARLYPELRHYPLDERQGALARARLAPFDYLEWFGLAIGLAMVTAMTSYAVGGLTPAGRVARTLLNLVVAFPLLAVALGPFVVRRTRRALRMELHGRLRSAERAG
jgi:hypothetical protein